MAPVQVPGATFGGSAGIDDAGNVSLIYYDRDFRPIGVTRPAGSTSFGQPVVLGDRSSAATVTVAPDGQLVVLSGDTCMFCPAGLRVRTGRSFDQLSAPQQLSTNSSAASVAVTTGGRMVVAWRAGNSYRDAVMAATKTGDGGFGAAQVLNPATPTPPGVEEPGEFQGQCDGNMPESQISTAINANGVALVSWRQRADDRCGDAHVYAATSTLGGSFGDRELVASHSVKFLGRFQDTLASLDPDNTAHVLYGPRDSAIARATRTPLGTYADDPDTGWERLVDFSSNAQGDQVATWTNTVGPDGVVESGPDLIASRPAGGAFGPSAPFGLTGDVLATGLDGHGNLLGVVTGPSGKIPQTLRAFAANGTDTASADVSAPTPPDLWWANIRVNESGAAVVTAVQQHWIDDPAPAGVFLLERSTNDRASSFVALPDPPSPVQDRAPSRRAADTVAPALSLTVAVRPRGVVQTRLRCSETCRVSAVLTIASRKGRVASVRAKPIVLPTGRPGRLALRLSRSQQRNLRRLLRAHRRVRVMATVNAADPSGNTRTARRTIAAGVWAR